MLLCNPAPPPIPPPHPYPYPTRFRSPLSVADVGPPLPDVGNSLVTPSFAPLLNCVALLVSHANSRAADRTGTRIESMVRGVEGAGKARFLNTLCVPVVFSVTVPLSTDFRA